MPKKSPVKLGEMIYTISQKIMSEDYDEIDNSRKIFAGIMTTALVAKCASLGSENLIKQANEIDKFLASALYATLPEETKKHSSEIFDEICELTRSALRKCGLPEENVKRYFSALNIYDQTHSSSTTPSEWNYSFTKDAANTFIAFNDNGRITNYFHDMRLIDISIQEMLNNLKAHPSHDAYAYSLIQKVGASLTGQEYKTNQIKLEELNKVDAQTILLTTLNLLSTIEKDVDPSKKEDFDKLVATLVLPATELNASMTNQEKEAILEKMKQLCASDPEISAIAGTSDIFKEETEAGSEKDEEIARLTTERDTLSDSNNTLKRKNKKLINGMVNKNAVVAKKIRALEEENKDLKTKGAKPSLKKPQDPYKMALGWLKTEIKRMSKKATKKGDHDKAEKLKGLYADIDWNKGKINPVNSVKDIKATGTSNQLSVYTGLNYCSNVAAFAIEKRDDGTTIVDKKDVKKSLREEIIPQMLDDYGKSLE